MEISPEHITRWGKSFFNILMSYRTVPITVSEAIKIEQLSEAGYVKILQSGNYGLFAKLTDKGRELAKKLELSEKSS